MSQNVNAWIRILYLVLTFGLSLTILKIILQTIDDPTVKKYDVGTKKNTVR